MNAFERLNGLRRHLATVFHGKPEALDLALVALLAEGHLLIEDVPGVGKTLLAKALAKSLGCSFQRIQFTPDLLPSDLLGVSVFDPATSKFVFNPGPIFAQVVLADEVNRATPRTQSALLEAMSERQVTLEGKTRPLGPPFLVLATQNHYEFEGTYPLPESQLDRFLMRIRLGYPDRAAERSILSQHRAGEPVDTLGTATNAEEIGQMQAATRAVTVAEPIQEYLLDIVAATRAAASVRLGASTRAALAFYRAVQARAVIANRDYVTPDDVKRLAGPVLAHRLLLRGQARTAGRADPAEDAVAEILAKLPAPR